MTPKEIVLSPTAIYLQFYDFDGALDIAREGEQL